MKNRNKKINVEGLYVILVCIFPLEENSVTIKHKQWYYVVTIDKERRYYELFTKKEIKNGPGKYFNIISICKPKPLSQYLEDPNVKELTPEQISDYIDALNIL